MDESLRKYLSGEINAVRAEVVISRERVPNGVQFISVSTADGLLFSFWHNPKRPAQKEQPPKHTGGKQPYIMCMVGEVEKLRAQGVVGIEELVGVLVCLGHYIEWSTGRLIHKRSKEPLKYKDLRTLFTFSNRKLNRILGELKEHDLLFGTSGGYVVSSRFIKKGKTKEATRDGL